MSPGRDAEDFNENLISFRYPAGWHVTGFSTSNSPRRLAVTTYAVSPDAVEGDCGGYEAVRLLPPEGALIVLIDYGPRRSFAPRPRTLTMRDGEFAEYECFGASSMFRFRVGDRGFQAHVAVGSDASNETQERALAVLASLTVDEHPKLVPPTYSEADRVILPVTFPDGTTAELVYTLELDLAALGAFPYGSGTLRGRSTTVGRSDTVARDFWIRHGDVEDVLALRNDNKTPMLLATYGGSDGQDVGFWDLRTDDTAHYLGFQFGRWAVLVYDYVGVGAMTDAERSSWAASFSGRETDEGFLVLEGSGPLRLAKAREHAGPQLAFAEGNPTRHLTLFPGTCTPHRDQTRVVDGQLVQWSGGFADWCLSESMRIHASGDQAFVGPLIRGLDVRDVVLATG